MEPDYCECEAKGHYGKANPEFNFGIGSSSSSDMWSLLAESYYYPTLSWTGSPGTLRSHISVFWEDTAWFLDPVKQEIKKIKRQWVMRCMQIVPRGSLNFFFYLNKYTAFQNRSHISENRMIKAFRQQKETYAAALPDIWLCGLT